MSVSTASEKGISFTPEVKLTHTMTPQDVDKIARITGRIVENGTPYLRTYYGGKEKGFPTGIKYLRLEAEIDFVGGPISVVMEAPQAFLKVDKNDISLNNSAVVIGEDSVTFVRRPQSETDNPVSEEQNLTVSTVTISRDSITYQKAALQNAREDVQRAANVIDEAYRAKHVAHRS